MPLFSDFGSSSNKSEEAASLDGLSSFSVENLKSASNMLDLQKPYSSSLLGKYISELNSQLGEMFPSVRALPGENILSQGGRLLGQSSLATGPSSVVRAGTKVASDVLQGMGTAADQLKQGDYLGAGLNTVGPVLNAPSNLLGQTVEEFAGPQAANAPLFTAPVVGDVSARNIAEFAGAVGAPQTALERGVGSVVGKGLSAGPRQIGQRTAEELIGAGVGGYLGYQNPPSNPLAPSEPGQEPTFRERVSGGVTGAVLGSQVPKALRAAAGAAEDIILPGTARITVTPKPFNSLDAHASSFGREAPAVTTPIMDQVIGRFAKGNIPGTNTPIPIAVGGLDSLFDRFHAIDRLVKYARSRGAGNALQADAYTYARVMGGSGITATETLKSKFMPIFENASDYEVRILDSYLASIDELNKATILGERKFADHIEKPLENLVQNDPMTARLFRDPTYYPYLSDPSKLYHAPAQVIADFRRSPAADKAYMDAITAGSQLSNTRAFGSVPTATPLDILAQSRTEIDKELDNKFINNPNGAATIRNMALQVRGYNDYLRQRMLDNGLISQELYDYFTKHYPDYSPTVIVDYLKNRDIKSARAGGQITISASDLIDSLSAESTKLNRIPPTQALIDSTHAIESTIAKNDVGRAISDLATTVPEIGAVVRKLGPTDSPSPRDVTFTVFENGKPSVYALDRSYSSLVQFDKDVISPWIRLGSYLTGAPLVRTAATVTNSSFVVANAFRDLVLATYRNWAEGVPFRQSLGQMAKAYADTFAELGRVGSIGTGYLGSAAGSSIASQVSDFTNQPEDVKTAAQFAGGVLGGIAGYNLPGGLRRLRGGAAQVSQNLSPVRMAGVAGENLFSGSYTPQSVYRLLRGDSKLGTQVEVVFDAPSLVGKIMGAMSLAGELISVPFKPIKAIGEAVEAAPRVAAYRIAEQAGKTAPESALAAREITMDFDRAGNMARTINSFVPFFNVGLQGSERFIRRDVANLIRNPKTAGPAFTTMVIIPALLSEWYNRKYFPNEYADTPNYLKESGITLVAGRTPDTQSGTAGVPRFYHFSMPQEFRFMQTALVNLIDKALSDPSNPRTQQFLLDLGLRNPDRGPAKSWSDIGLSILKGITPVQTEAMQLGSPLGQTAFELQANRDLYRGLAIVPDPLHALPPERQVRPWNSALSRAMSDEYRRIAKSVGIDTAISPAKLEYAILSLTGGTGRTILQGADLLMRKAGYPGAEQPPNTSFSRQFLDYGRNSILGAFYREAGDQVNQSARDAVKAALPEIVRQSNTNLQNDPEFQKLPPAQQAEELRKLDLAAQQLVFDAQPPSVFEGTNKTYGEFKYLNSKTYNDDKLTDDAIQTYTAWKENPSIVPKPSDDIIGRAIVGERLRNKVYNIEQKKLEQMRNTALIPVRANPVDYSKR